MEWNGVILLLHAWWRNLCPSVASFDVEAGGFGVGRPGNVVEMDVMELDVLARDAFATMKLHGHRRRRGSTDVSEGDVAYLDFRRHLQY